MKAILTILGGLGAGAALMYLFDPNDGNRRRGLIRDKAASLNNKTQTAIGGRFRDAGNRAKGLLHNTKSAISGRSAEQSSFGTDNFSSQEAYNS